MTCLISIANIRNTRCTESSVAAVPGPVAGGEQFGCMRSNIWCGGKGSRAMSTRSG